MIAARTIDELHDLAAETRARLAAMKAEGLTIDQMVDALRDDEVEVSRESVRRWLLKLEVAS